MPLESGGLRQGQPPEGQHRDVERDQDGGRSKAQPPAPGVLSTCRRLLEDQSLASGLVLATILALKRPSFGVAVASTWMPKYATNIIFYIVGLRLRAEEVQHVYGVTQAMIWGVLSTMIVTAVMGTWIVKLLPCRVPELSKGLLVLVSMPAAVSSSASLTIQAGGNFAFSVLLAVTCHVLSAATIPFLLLRSFLTEQEMQQLFIAPLILRLAATTLIPLALGQASVLASRRIRNFVRDHPRLLTLTTNALVVLTPWLHMSRSSESNLFSRVTAFDLTRMTVASVIIPVAFSAVNLLAASAMNLTPDMVKSITIVASSKTLPLAIAVLGMLPESVGDVGLLVLPIIECHLAHIFFCSVLARFWKGKYHAKVGSETDPNFNLAGAEARKESEKRDPIL